MVFSVRNKLLAGFLVLVVAMVTLGVISLAKMSAINANTKYIAANSVPSIVVIGKARAAVQDYRHDQLQHVIATVPDEMAALERDMRKQAGVVASSPSARRSDHAQLTAGSAIPP